MTTPGPLTRFTSNANTNSQLEALKFNYQGQLDPGKGLALRTWRKKSTPFSSKLARAEEMDPSQILFTRLKVSQISLYQASPAKQPNQTQPNPTKASWGQHRVLSAGDLFCHFHLFGRELSPATWVTHILGHTHGSGTGGHRSLCTHPYLGLAAASGTHQHRCRSILQPTTGLQRACR